MRKWISLLAVIAMLAVSPLAFAGNKNDLAYKSLDELDTMTSVAVTDGIIVTRGDVPYQGMTVSDISKVGVAQVEVHATTDQTQVLATETGKTFIATQNTKFQLPAAADGLVYTFVAGASVEIDIQVNTTPDTIVFQIADGNGNGTIETAGVNTTGNSVTLASDGTNWYAVKSTGTWSTGGAWSVLDMGAQE